MLRPGGVLLLFLVLLMATDCGGGRGARCHLAARPATPRMPSSAFPTVLARIIHEDDEWANREAIARIIAYARKRPSIMIDVSTNATTLSEMADFIGPGRGSIQAVQITLDGDRQLHDENRRPVSGMRSFSRYSTSEVHTPI